MAKKRAAKRRTAARAKPRKAAGKKLRKARPGKEASIVDVVTGAVTEAGQLRSRLAGPNTFED